MTSTHAYTCLSDIMEEVQTPEIKLEITNAVVWRAGTLIVAECRKIIRSMKEEAAQSSTYSPADFDMLLREDEFMAEWLSNTGITTTSSSQRIADLDYIRRQMIEEGTEVASLCIGWDGNPRTFKYSTIEDEINKTMPTGLSETEQRRIKMDVENQVERGRVEAKYKDRMEKDRLEAAAANRKKMAEAVMAQRDLVMKVWEHVERKVMLNDIVPQDFYQMDHDLKQALVTSCLQGGERAKSNAGSDKRMTDGVYALFLNDYYKLEDKLIELRNSKAVTTDE